jgi:hypothetical protein
MNDTERYLQQLDDVSTAISNISVSTREQISEYRLASRLQAAVAIAIAQPLWQVDDIVTFVTQLEDKLV